MAEARERSRSPMSVRWSVSSWKDLLFMKVTEESQLLLVSNALADAEDERWNPPGSSSRAFGLKVIWGSDIYIEFRDHLTCTSDEFEDVPASVPRVQGRVLQSSYQFRSKFKLHLTVVS